MMFKILVRFIIKPFLDALKAEASIDWDKKYDLEEDLKKQLQEMSQKQIRVLLNDQLSAQVIEMQVELRKKNAQIDALYKEIYAFQEFQKKITVLVGTYRNEVRVVAKLFRSIQNNDTQKYFDKNMPVREIQTEELSFE